MNWLIVFAFVCVSLGFISGIFALKTMRSRAHPQAEIAWKQNPLWVWKYEPVSMTAITIQSLGLICLAVIFLLALRHTILFKSIPRSGLVLVVTVVALAGVFFTTYTSGRLLAYHFARRWVGPLSYGISREGIFYSNDLISWKSCNHYEIGPDDGQISLYSSYSPSLRTWVLQPSPELFPKTLAIVQENLPSSPSMADPVTWKNSPLRLVLEMTATSLALLLPAVWGLLRNQSWVWGYALVEFVCLGILGNRLIMIFDGREKYKEQKVQTASVTDQPTDTMKGS